MIKDYLTFGDYFFGHFRKIEFTKMSLKEQLIFCECRDTKSWEGWNIQQRKRKKEQIVKIFKKLEHPIPLAELDRYIDYLEKNYNRQSRLKIVYCETQHHPIHTNRPNLVQTHLKLVR